MEDVGQGCLQIEVGLVIVVVVRKPDYRQMRRPALWRGSATWMRHRRQPVSRSLPLLHVSLTYRLPSPNPLTVPDDYGYHARTFHANALTAGAQRIDAAPTLWARLISSSFSLIFFSDLSHHARVGRAYSQAVMGRPKIVGRHY